MEVLGYDPYLSQRSAEAAGVKLLPLEELLQRSDYVSLHCPLTVETHHLLGEPQLRLMKKGARLVNAARGGLVDEAALLKLLDEGWLAGAALDVFEEEPPKDFALARHPLVLATPHLGASTEEAQTYVAVDVAQQVVDVLEGRPARSAVNMPPIEPELLERFAPYLALAAQMGKLLAQVVEAPAHQLHLEFAGEVAAGKIPERLARYMVMGFLQPALGSSVNLVNASVLAKARGIEVCETRHGLAHDYASLLTVTARTNKGEASISGTVFGRQDARVVNLMGYRLDMRPQGEFLLIYHTDRPGLIGAVGTILGSRGINIAEMLVGREAPRGRALMVLAVDDPVPDEVQQEISRVAGISSVKDIAL